MPGSPYDKTLLVISQVYVPDPAAVGQQMADAAAEMAKRGWRVRVLTAGRGYEDPSVKYPKRERLNGVEVRRLPLSSFGKSSIPIRLLGGCLFLIQAILHGLFTRGLACILVSTSPPICPIAALVVAAIRRVPIKYWVMDLNPDQMIALDKIAPTSLPARVFEALNRVILSRADAVVALDSYMGERLLRKLDVTEKLSVIPPWPHQEHLRPVAHGDNPFRAEQGLRDKFVIMFSGNLSIASPATTILEASRSLRDRSDLVFAFVGGGLGKQEVERFIREHHPDNVISLPYQPLERIGYSLSAADIHLVTMGERITGICHPCKVYGAMAIGRPILLLGPERCHIMDLIREHDIGWRVPHGDPEHAAAVIRQILDTDTNQLAAMGKRASAAIDRRYNKELLCGRFCEVLEHRA